MRLSLSLTFLLLFTSFFVNGQQHYVDSLLAVLETQQEKDTNRVITLNELASKYRFVDAEKAEKYALMAKNLAEEIGFLKGKANALRGLGSAYHAKSDFKKAIEYLQQALAVYIQAGLIQGEASAYGNIGACYDELGHYQKAIEYYQKAQKIFEELGLEFNVGITLYNMGIASEREGNFDKATEYLLESIRIAEKVNDEIGIAFGCHALGNIQLGQKRLDLALPNFERARKIQEKLGNKRGIAKEYLSLGKVLQGQGKLVEARAYLSKAITLLQEVGDKKFVAIAYNNMGNTYEEEKVYNKALEYYQKSFKIRQEVQSNYELAKSLRSIGQIYQKLGQLAQAKSYFLQSLDSSQQIGAKDHIVKAYQALALLDSVQGNYRSAFRYHRLYTAMKDSVFSEAREKLITEMNLKYETEKKEKEIAGQKMQLNNQELEIQRKNTQNLALGIGGLLTLILAVVFFRGRQKQKRANQLLHQQNQHINEQKEEIRSQAEEIRSQAEELRVTNEKLVMLDEFKQNLTGMIVHDLKNPLNVVLSLADHPRVKQAGEQMLILTTNLLDTQKFEEAEIKLTNEDILVSKLIQAAKSRVDIVAKEKGIQIEVHSAPQNAVFADLDLITRVMVNLLTNSIKYSPHQSTITLTSSIIEERMVKIEIQDEGQGIPKEKQGVIFQKFGQVMAKKSGAVRSTGIGLYFCKLAIEAHMGEIGVESAVGEGANFWFTIPIGNVDGEIALPEEVVETEIPQAKLSDTDKQFLKSILVNYEGVKMYELTKMRQLLNQISEDSVGITDWKGKLKQAIDSMDEQAFHNLVSTL